MDAKANAQDAKSQEGKAGGTQGAAGEEDLSMEEILQSIRRIIAEDDKDAAKKPEAKPAPAKSAGKDEDIPGSDVFELTEMLKEDGSVVNVKTEMAKEAAAKDVLNKIDEALVTEKKTAPADIKPDAKPAAAPAAGNPQDDIDALFSSISPPAAPAPLPEAAAPQPAPAKPDAPQDSLLSEAAASASMSAFNKLKAVEQYVPPAQTTQAPAFRDGTTVEDLVSEMLRPMMKAWLDTNLPQIVERIVEREVRKLTK